MAEEQQVRQFVSRLASAFHPDRVILFGSHARGEASADSDVDLLVIMRTDKRTTQQALDIRQHIRRDFPLDLLVRTPEQIERRLALRDAFVTAILAEGKTLYESPGE